MRERMRRMLEEGPKLYGEFYDRDLRIDATMLKYSSPYPGVRAVADPVDDVSALSHSLYLESLGRPYSTGFVNLLTESNKENVAVETFRAYFLGIGWAVM